MTILNILNINSNHISNWWIIYLCIICLCILTGYFLYPKIIQYYTPENYKGKTFISTWVQNSEPYIGLGDIIRGTLLLYQLSKQLQFKLIVDISQHPVSKFLKYDSNHPHKKLLEEAQYNIPYIGLQHSEVLNFLRTQFTNRDVIWGLTNATTPNFWDTVSYIEKDEEQFLQKIFVPTPQLEKQIQTYLNRIPKSFVALHYRIGDHDIINKATNSVNEEKAVQHVQKQLKPNTVFFSDSQILKNVVRKHFKDVIVFDHEIGHIGVETNDQKICNTLIEFFILSKAQHIHTINHYDWISNFTNIIHKIYHIPLTFEKNSKF